MIYVHRRVVGGARQAVTCIGDFFGMYTFKEHFKSIGSYFNVENSS